MTEQNPIVFVVDDDASVRKALHRLFTSVGMDVLTFASAREFAEYEHPDRPGCLVLDVRMPGQSGLDLQDELAAADIDMPIVFISGHGDVPISVRAMKKGAMDFLPKPFDDQDLLDAVHQAIDRHIRVRQERAEIDDIQERVDRLTPREREVLALVVTGMLNKQIAGQLGTTEKTVKVHRARVMQKMEVESVAELVRLAARVGIVAPD